MGRREENRYRWMRKGTELITRGESVSGRVDKGVLGGLLIGKKGKGRGNEGCEGHEAQEALSWGIFLS